MRGIIGIKPQAVTEEGLPRKKHRAGFPSFGRHALPGVAPPGILREDFRELDSSVLLRTAGHVEQLVLVQSVTGHAHVGHGRFHGRTFPNTTEDDVARALWLDPEVVKRERQELIDEIRDYADRAAAGKADGTLSNADQDWEIARNIENARADIGVGPDDACRLAFLAAEPEGREEDIPDSSLRGLLEIDRKHDLCALESHLLFVAGRSVPETDLDHGRCTNLEFYRYAQDRLAETKS